MALNQAQLMATPQGTGSVSGYPGAVKAGTGITIAPDGTISANPVNVGVTSILAGSGIAVNQPTGTVTVSLSEPAPFLKLNSPTVVQTVNGEVDFIGNSATNNPTLSVVGTSPSGFAPAFTSWKDASFTRKLINLSYEATNDSGFISIFGPQRILGLSANGNRGQISLSEVGGTVLTSLEFDTDNLYGESYIANKLGPTSNIGAWFRAFDGTTVYGWWGRRSDGLQGIVLSQPSPPDTQDFAATTGAVGLSTATSEAFVESGQTKIARINSSGCQGLSDLNLKTNVVPLPYGLAELDNLEPINFQYDFTGTVEITFPGVATNYVYTNEDSPPVIGSVLTGVNLAPDTVLVSIEPYDVTMSPNQTGITQPYAYIYNLSKPTLYSTSTPATFDVTWEWLSNTVSGFGAQDVELQIPTAVTQQQVGGQDYYFMDYNAITATLVNSVKQLAAQVSALELQVQALTP